MSKPVEELLQSIEDDFAAAKQPHEDLEAKALFRLLNCCLPASFVPSKSETQNGELDGRAGS